MQRNRLFSFYLINRVVLSVFLSELRKLQFGDYKTEKWLHHHFQVFDLLLTGENVIPGYFSINKIGFTFFYFKLIKLIFAISNIQICIYLRFNQFPLLLNEKMSVYDFIQLILLFLCYSTGNLDSSSFAHPKEKGKLPYFLIVCYTSNSRKCISYLLFP